MKKIAVIGVYSDNNLGDPLVFDCNSYMLRKVSTQEIQIDFYDFIARTEPKTFIKPEQLGLSLPEESSRRRLIKRFLGENATTFLYQNNHWRKQQSHLRTYYKNAFHGVDMIMVAGAGTIKYVIRRDYSRYYALIAEYASSHGIPVVVSSAGVEDNYNPLDGRCRRFSKALSNESFKIVTTRDNIQELRKYIHNPNCDVARVADYGIFASEVYGIRKNEASNKIGIGIIASSRFEENKKAISEEQYKRTVFEMVKRLNSQGVEWSFFTNGGLEDSILAIDFCRELGEKPEIRLSIPTSPRELVEVVSGFRGIITARLHSCIVAYSLGIPFVAFGWNNKLQYFADTIGCPDRIITDKIMNTDTILNKLYVALEEGFDQRIKKENEDIAIKYAKKYISILDYTN